MLEVQPIHQAPYLVHKGRVDDRKFFHQDFVLLISKAINPMPANLLLWMSSVIVGDY